MEGQQAALSLMLPSSRQPWRDTGIGGAATGSASATSNSPPWRARGSAVTILAVLELATLAAIAAYVARPNRKMRFATCPEWMHS